MTKAIPNARDRILALADQLRKGAISTSAAAAELELIEAAMYRRPYVRRAAPIAQKVTPGLVRQVKAFARKHPDTPQREIARLYHLDGGRVSEILQGDHD